MTITTYTLEEELVSLYSVEENEVGLGKIIYNAENNESIISNGKTLVSFGNTKLEESTNITLNEKTLISNLANNLIHSNYGEMIACELYFSQSDVMDLLNHMTEYQSDKLKLTFNNKLNIVLVSPEGNPTMVKILEPKQINKFKSTNMTATIEVNQLFKTVQLLHNHMDANSVFGFALQYHNRPVLMVTEQVSACISCIK